MNIRQFFRDETGATAVEYGLIAASLGGSLEAIFNFVSTTLSGAVAAGTN